MDYDISQLSHTDKFLYDPQLFELSRHCIQFAYYMSKNDKPLEGLKFENNNNINRNPNE